LNYCIKYNKIKVLLKSKHPPYYYYLYTHCTNSSSDAPISKLELISTERGKVGSSESVAAANV